MDELMSWPLSWIPLAPYAPQLIRIPAQAIGLTCTELHGNNIGSHGETQLIEVAKVYLPGDFPTLTGPGTNLELDIANRDAAERAGAPEPIWLRQQHPNGLRPLPAHKATSGTDLLGTAAHRYITARSAFHRVLSPKSMVADVLRSWLALGGRW